MIFGVIPNKEVKENENDLENELLKDNSFFEKSLHRQIFVLAILGLHWQCEK